MAVWKAIVITQSNLDSNGVSETVFDVYKDAGLKFEDQIVKAAAGEETTKILAELTRHKNEDEAFVTLAPGTEIILP